MIRRILFEMRFTAFALHLNGWEASASLIDGLADQLQREIGDTLTA